MSTILVTGGFGFVGGALVEALAFRGHAVRVLDPHCPEDGGLMGPAVETVAGSVFDTGVLAAAFEGTELCVHLAGSTETANPRLNPDVSPEPFLAVAEFLFGTAAQRGVPVIYASSAAVYGDAGPGPIMERTPAAPINAHGEEKLVFETVARQVADARGLPSLGLRMFNVYGPRQSVASPYCGVVRHALQNIIDGDPVIVYGDGSHLRDFIHIDDVVRFIVGLTENPLTDSGVANVCTGRGLSVNQVVAMVAAAADRTADIVYRGDVSDGVASSVGDPSHARARYGFDAQISAEDGIAGMAAAVLATHRGWPVVDRLTVAPLKKETRR